jgi:hypothetical protein
VEEAVRLLHDQEDWLASNRTIIRYGFCAFSMAPGTLPPNWANKV